MFAINIYGQDNKKVALVIGNANYSKCPLLNPLNVADAQYNLAFVYTKGRGVDKSYEIAHFWYCKAAEQGHKKAKEKLRLGY